MSKIKIYNCFNVVSDDNPNMKKEKFTKKSLVDPLEKVPTLKEYVNKYIATGDISVLPFKDNEPIDELLPGEDEEDFSSPLYDKDADYDELIDASKVEGVENVKDAYIKSVSIKGTKKFVKDKLSKETTENKEKIYVAKDNVNTQKETIE